MTQQELMVNAALSNWKLTVKRASGVFDVLSDEQFHEPVAPGRNRPVYLLGHLTAVHDLMLPLIGLGERRHPELDAVFLSSPDGTIDPLPPVSELKGYWDEVNGLLQEGFTATTPEQWLQRHNSMTDEDFLADPTRNKFSVLLNRTNHTAFHLGQLVFAKKRA